MLLDLPLLSWLPAGLYLAGALGALLAGASRWRVLAATTRGALAAALIGAAAILLTPRDTHDAAGSATAAIVATLIAFLGWIIGDYSRRYLRGEPGQARFVTAYLVTLAAVSAVVASADLAWLTLAWAASSAGLHHLLTFYRDRPAALVAAHKKFLASRLAEACLVIAAVLLYREWGTLELAELGRRAEATAALSGTAHAAAVLVVVAVLLKCAQLPLHGWLIQVMEAPTPVSALLHAGVVNLGGYVLIRLAPLLETAPAAQALLVVGGGLTATLAGLVMLTRITVKVRLAWSTCSQMGLMVMECGLGLYDLALLHLLAHSLYKAHAFLTAGEAVRDGLARRLLADTASARPARPLRSAAFALAAAALVIAASETAWREFLHAPPVAPVALALLAFGLATLLWSPAQDLRRATTGLVAVTGATQFYLGWHWLLAGVIGLPAHAPDPLLATLALLLFLALYAVQAWVLHRPASASRSRAYDWAYAGFYLDERFTRLTFRIWPPRVVATPGRAPRATHSTEDRSLA